MNAQADFVAALLERDNAIPPLEVWVQEAQRAQTLLEATRPTRRQALA